MTTTTLTQQQIHALTRFVSKHHTNEIHLNKAESRYFFDYIETSSDLERSRILLQPAFAEGYFRNDHGDLVVVIIPREKVLQTGDITWEDGYDDRPHDDNANHYNPFTRKLFEIFVDKMSLDLLLEKLADRLNQRYPLSKGQATALMTKVMGFRLDSGTRSFLHDLRKKIRKYQQLISEFQEYVLENEEPKLVPRKYMDELVQNIEVADADKVLEKVPDEWINRTKEDKYSEFKDILEARKQISERDGNMEKLEKRFAMQKEPLFEFACEECDQTQVFVPDHDDTEMVESPRHHDQPMILRIIPRE